MNSEDEVKSNLTEIRAKNSKTRHPRWPFPSTGGESQCVCTVYAGMGGAGGTNENQGKGKGGESTPWSSDRTLQPVVEGEEAVAQGWLGDFFGALRPAAVVQVEFLLRRLLGSEREREREREEGDEEGEASETGQEKPWQNLQ